MRWRGVRCGLHHNEKHARFLSLAGIGLLLCSILVCQSTRADSHDTTTLEQLEFTAPANTQTTGEVVHEEHTGSTSQITRQRLQQFDQMGDVLAGEAGVQQLQVGGFGTFSSITMRGASGAQTAVYLDGILLNSGAQAVVDLSMLELLNLDSVDIYRGTAPLQLGHGSIGGAVNLNSRSADGDSRPRVRLNAGSFGQRGARIGIQGTRGQWDWVGSASHQQSENNFKFNNDNGTPLNTDDDLIQRRNNSDVKRAGVLLKTGYQASDRYRTDFILHSTSRSLGVPQWLNSADNQASVDTDRHQVQLSQTIDDLFRWNTRHTLYLNSGTTHFEDLLKQIGLTAEDIQSRDRTIGAKSYWETFTDVGTLGLSLNLWQERLKSSDAFSADDSYKAKRDGILATAHLAWLDSSERWSITPALRWQRLKNTLEIDQMSATEEEQSSANHDSSLQIGTAWQLSKSVVVSANAGNYFREPSFGELYATLGLINGNSELVPEKGTNIDVGLRYENETMQFSLTAFYNRIDELIVTIINSQGSGRLVNTGEADVRGIELSADWRWNTDFKFSTNATLQDPRNLDEFVGFNNKILPGEARQSYAARIRYQPARLAYWYEWQATRDRFYDTANLLAAENTSIHSVGLEWQIGSWQFETRIHNLGNDKIEDFNRFPKPGRTWSLAITRKL